jgi:hypothetical protein
MRRIGHGSGTPRRTAPGEEKRMEATSAGRAAAWILLAAAGVANAAGYALDLYGRFWWFDRVLHACTIFALTVWLALILCRRALRGGDGNGALLVLLIASVGVAAGAVWEVMEWIFDRIAPGDVIKGKNDTIIDIVMDTVGALLAGLASLGFLRPSKGAGGGGAA